MKYIWDIFNFYNNNVIKFIEKEIYKLEKKIYSKNLFDMLMRNENEKLLEEYKIKLCEIYLYIENLLYDDFEVNKKY